MSEFNRITVEEVKNAYKETGLKPKQGNFFPEPGCACGLGAIYIQKSRKENFGKDKVSVMNKLSYTYPRIYQVGFANGFDGIRKKSEFVTTVTRDHYHMGYEDGKAAYEAVRKDVKNV
jgi:hypothetical protein